MERALKGEHTNKLCCFNYLNIKKNLDVKTPDIKGRFLTLFKDSLLY